MFSKACLLGPWALKAVLAVMIVAQVFLFTLPAIAKSKQKLAPKTAASSSSDQKTFSMVLEPKTHPFCNRTEHDASNPNRMCEAENVHALLSPSTCLAADSVVDSRPNWELSPDPFFSKPYIESGIWSDDVSVWSGMDRNPEKCMAGKADIVLERAFKYGFCSEEEYALNAPPDVPDVRFGLQVADYYLINIVVWKGAANKLAVVSSLGALSGKTALLAGIEITSGTTNKQYNGSNIDELISNINKDKDLGAKATLTANGHLRISGPTSAKGLTVTGNKDVFGDWGSPIEGPYSVDSSRWYSYNHGDHGHWYRQRLDDFSPSLRVYGTKKPIGVIAIYVKNTNGVWDQFDELKVQYKIAVQAKTAANISDLTTAISIITTKAAAAQRPSPCAAQTGPKVDSDGFYGATFINAKAPADLAVTVEVDFPASADSGGEKPAPTKPPAEAGKTANGRPRTGPTFQLASFAPNASGMRAPDAEREQAGNGTGQTGSPGQTPAQGGANNPAKPSQPKAGTQDQPSKTPTAPTVDCQAILDQKGQQSACKLTVTYNDEDLYHWDVSFGVPFKTLSELQYQQPTGNGTAVVPKNVTRLNAYGFFDIFPVATDITDLPLFAWPHIKLGLPISGKVFNKPFFGAGDGFNVKKVKPLSFLPLQVQFFGGVAYNKESRQIPGTTGSSNVYGHRVWSGLYGIEIPVGQFKGLLSSGKNNKKTSSTGGSPTTPNGNSSQ